MATIKWNIYSIHHYIVAIYLLKAANITIIGNNTKYVICSTAHCK